MNRNDRSLGLLIGLSTVGGGITGLVAFIAAVYALFSGELTAAGVCLAAAALAFGLSANAVLRD